ncbi:MAG: 6-phosphogluconolactonase (cycloisomerase 2 family) [Planctomycetota bacterium]|jgi:6-phosphogluconolactonase (cycloisomerase 2 family)
MASIRLSQIPGLLLITLSAVACSGSSGGSSGTLGPTAASFPNSAYTLLLGVPVEQVSNARPNVSGDAEEWSVTPSLPAGLSLNTSSGTIQGTPSVASERSAYTITARGHGVSVSTLVQVGVSRPARQGMLANADGSLMAYAVDATSGRLTPQRQGETTLDGIEQVLSSPFAPVFYALASSGSLGAPALVALGLDASGEFQILAEVPVLLGPNQMGMTADGQTMIVASASSGAVTSYMLDSTTGLPSPATSSFTPAPDSDSLSVDPLGRFIYVISKVNQEVLILDLDTSTATVSMSQLPFSLGSTVPEALTVSPDGKNLYLTTESFNFVLGLAIDPVSGALTVVNNQVVGSDPVSLSMHPEGLALIVSDPTEGLVRVLPRNVQSGVLGQPGEGHAVGTDARPSFDESGLLLWVLDQSGSLASFEVNPANGSLSPGGQFAGRTGSVDVVSLGGDGPLAREVAALYALNRTSESVTIYGPDGVQGAYLERGMAVPTGTDPVALALRPGGELLAVANRGSNSITLIELDASGNPQTTASFNSAGPAPSGLAFDLSGNLLIVARAGSSEVATYAVDSANLNLIPVDTRLVDGSPEHLALSDNGRFLVISETNNKQLIVVGIEDGQFSGPNHAIAAGGNPGHPTILADGHTILLPLTDSSAVQVFTLNPQDGVPSALGSNTATGDGPNALAVHPSGKWAYSANTLALGNGAVQLFDLDESNGSLSPRTQLEAGTTPRALLLDPNGTLLFVANSGADNLSLFAVDTDGELTATSTLSTDTTPWSLGSLVRYQ